MSTNPYRRLLNLLPKRPLQVGTVIGSTAGVCTVELPGGGTIQARGDHTIGASVFVRDGVIEGPAPSLTPISIEI